MTRWRSFLVVVVIALSAGGCAFRGSNQFDEAILSQGELDRIKSTYIDADVELAFQTAPDRLLYRNTVLAARLRYVDAHYAVLEKRLRTGRAELTFAKDASTLVLNGVGALTGAAATKAILHGISAGIVGGHAAFEKDFYQDQAPNVIIPEMQALRKEQYLEIQRQRDLPLGQYSLQDALADVDKYLRAGSVTEALISLANKSGTKATEAAKATDAVLKARYDKFNSQPEAAQLRQVITQWWHSDDMGNTPILQKFMPQGVEGQVAMSVWLTTATTEELQSLAKKLSDAGASMKTQ